jgi:hypothetical protein
MQQTATSYEFPRVYRPSGFWRLFLVGLGIVAMTAGGLGVWYFGGGHELHGGGETLMTAISAGFLLLGLYLTAYVAKASLVLRQNGIEVIGIASNKEMGRDEILGYRTVTPQNGPPILVLVPRSEDGRKLKIPSMFQFDGAFDHWLHGFPDLDTRDAQAAEEEIQNNPELGATPAERAHSIKQAKLVCRALTVVTVIACGLMWFYPVPFRLVLACVVMLPWIAVSSPRATRGWSSSTRRRMIRIRV